MESNHKVLGFFVWYYNHPRKKGIDFSRDFSANMLSFFFTVTESWLHLCELSTQEALLARIQKRAELGYSFAFWLKNLQTYGLYF